MIFPGSIGGRLNRTMATAIIILLMLLLSGCAGQSGLSAMSEFSLGSLLGSTPSAANQPVPDIGITECDRLAAYDLDLARPADLPGVDSDDLDAPAAIAACERELRLHPNHPRLLTQLGRSYDAAYRYSDALNAYRSAAQAGYAYAAYMAGWYHQEGYSVPSDYDAAESWYRKAGQMGQPEAWNRIGLLYSDILEPKNPGKAISAYRRAADAGLTVAMTNLAIMLNTRDGWGDKSSALQWARKAADAGSSLGIRLVGDYYQGEENYDVAAQWYRRAADQNDAIGLYMVASYLYFGNAGSQDKATALTYYEGSARAGYMPAAVKAAMMYAKGDGVPMDHKQAMSWLRFGAPKKPGAS